MTLLRKSSKEQLERINKEIKKQGGDNSDRKSPAEKNLPNLYWMENPIGRHLDSYEDFYQTGNVTKMKNENYVKTFSEMINEEEKYFPHGVEHIPEFYLQHWLYYYHAWCGENEIKCKYSDLEEIKANKEAISEVFEYAQKYADFHNFKLDGEEFVSDGIVGEDNNVDILRVGKNIKLDKLQGTINRIEGNWVFVETKSETGPIIVKVPMSEVIKQYKDAGLKVSDKDDEQTNI